MTRVQPGYPGEHRTALSGQAVMLAMREQRDDAERLAEECSAVIEIAQLQRQYRIAVRHVRYPWWSFLTPGTGVQGWGVYLTAVSRGLQDMASAVLREVHYREQHAR